VVGLGLRPPWGVAPPTLRVARGRPAMEEESWEVLTDQAGNQSGWERHEVLVCNLGRWRWWRRRRRWVASPRRDVIEVHGVKW